MERCGRKKQLLRLPGDRTQDRKTRNRLRIPTEQARFAMFSYHILQRVSRNGLAVRTENAVEQTRTLDEGKAGFKTWKSPSVVLKTVHLLGFIYEGAKHTALCVTMSVRM